MKWNKHTVIVNFFLIIYLIIILSTSFVESQDEMMYLNEISYVRGSGYDVCIHSNYAYVTNNEGVDIIDVQDPANPISEARLEIIDGAFGIHIEGDILFVAAGGNGLVIADISNPLEPVQLGQSSNHGVARNVFVNGNYAYLACYENGLKVFNITDKTNPIKIGEYLDSGRIDNVVCKDQIAYLANPNLGVEIINITDQSTPVKISSIYSVRNVHDLSIFENYLFAGCYDSSVWVINITNPSNPSVIASHSDGDGGESQGVIGNSTHLFVADNNGVEYKDISNLPIISEVAETREGVGAAHDIDFVDNYLFVAGGGINRNLRIFEISSEQSDQVSSSSSVILISLISISIIFGLRFFKKKDN